MTGLTGCAAAGAWGARPAAAAGALAATEPATRPRPARSEAAPSAAAARPRPARTRDITGLGGTDRANRPPKPPKVVISACRLLTRWFGFRGEVDPVC